MVARTHLSVTLYVQYSDCMVNFDVLLTVHLSIFISVINQLDAQKFLFYNKFISCLYMFRAHVLIIRRSKLHYTASGIITPVGGRLVHRLKEDCSPCITLHYTAVVEEMKVCFGVSAFFVVCGRFGGR